MREISHTLLLIIDRLRSSPDNTASLIHAVGGGLAGHTGDAYTGMALFHLLRLNLVRIKDETGEIIPNKELLDSFLPEGTRLEFGLGYTISRKLVGEKGAKLQVQLTNRIFDLQEMIGFSITGLIANYSRTFTFNATPIFGQPRRDLKADVFVLMPFAEIFKPVFDDHIKPTCEKLNYSVRRADEIYRTSNIISDVWSLSYNAKYVIADCTSKNPNVFYELGVADTIGKEIILITQNKDDVPFDIRHRRYIEYQFTPRGMKDFESTLEKYLTANIWVHTDEGLKPSED